MGKIHDRIIGKASEGRIPVTGAFEITPMCNLSCKMCYVRKSGEETKAAGGLLPLSFWLDAAEQAKEAGCLFPLITGGEPLTYPHFWELYEAMQRMGMSVCINTNASLIDEEVIERFKKTPPGRINITLYGACKETYGRLCGDPDAYDRVVRAADLLSREGILFRFNCSLTPENAGDLDDMLALAKTYGKGLRAATYMFPPHRRNGTTGENACRLTPEEAAYYEAKINYLQASPAQFRRLAENVCTYREPSKEEWEKASAGEPGKMQCLSGRCSFWVDWRGRLGGCGANDCTTFSLHENTFAEAWKKLVAHTKRFSYSPYCNNCINRSVCFSCMAMVYNEAGDFNGRPVYLCEKAKYAAKWYAKFLERMPEESGETDGAYVPECPLDEFEAGDLP